MSRRKCERSQRAEPGAAERASQRPLLKAVAIPVAMAAVAWVGLGLLRETPTTHVTDTNPSDTPATAAKSPEGPRAAKAKPKPARADFGALPGKWFREDGGYLLEIKSVDAGGKLEAAYFNPRPISISKAEASRDENKIKVFVELRDEGYPGCTYNLTYDSEKQQLQGVYFQAALQESFDVVFTRNKQP
jgi:hypothetical protein